MHSLSEIEKNVSALWLDGELRSWFVKGASGKAKPAAAASLNLELLNSADRGGIDLYGRLINYGHHDVMESIYPYTKKLLGRGWDRAVDDYLKAFPPKHYNLNRLCRQFPEFVETHLPKAMAKYPFLAELAYYEWIELEKLEQDEDVVLMGHKELATALDVESTCPVVNPTCEIRRYEYPIPQIAQALETSDRLRRKVQSEETFVAAFRDSKHRARFIELGSTATALIEKVGRERTSYQELLVEACKLTPEVPPQEAAVDFLRLVENLQSQELFIGSIKKES